MSIRVILGLNFLALLWGVAYCQEGGPPRVTGSYKATGEMVAGLDNETGLVTQVAFEESFDADTKDASFRVWILGMNVTFVENFKTGQTFQVSESDGCKEMTVTEWVKTKSPPSLLAYEDTNGTVRFSLKQLFALNDTLLVLKNVSSEFRGMPARKWVYEVRGEEPDTGDSSVLSVNAYWSEYGWSTTSNKDSVPLGYVVSKMTYNRRRAKPVNVHEQFISVFAFVPNTVDRKLFEPIQGVHCEGRVQTIRFPDVIKMQAVAVHSEVIFPDYLEIKYVDLWLDTKNKLYRTDIERIKDEELGTLEKSLNYESEIAIQEMGVVFKTVFHMGMTFCSVIPFESYEFDIQNLFNFKLPAQEWHVGKLFGLNSTQYVYTGKTTKRGIPCHVFQGLRTDWPYPEANVTSLWDWCFSMNVSQQEKGVMFRGGDYGLVNAQVNILTSGLPGAIPPGFRLIHHFYHINGKDPGLMDSTNFDIGHCSQENEKRRMQLQIDWTVDQYTLPAIENATSDRIFLQKWKEALYQHTGLEPHTLRISNVLSFVNEGKLYLKFTLLAPHPFLPKEILKGQKTSFEAENMLRDKVNKKKVSILYTPFKGAQAVTIFAKEHTVKFEINDKFQPHTVTPTKGTPPTVRTTVDFSIITEPERPTTTSATSTTTQDRKTTDSGRSTKKPPKPRTSPQPEITTKAGDREELPSGRELHGPGAVAGVSISMLLVGITIGSAGIFVRYNGLPACLKGAT